MQEHLFTGVRKCGMDGKCATTVVVALYIIDRAQTTAASIKGAQTDYSIT